MKEAWYTIVQNKFIPLNSDHVGLINDGIENVQVPDDLFYNISVAIAW